MSGGKDSPPDGTLAAYKEKIARMEAENKKLDAVNHRISLIIARNLPKLVNEKNLGTVEALKMIIEDLERDMQQEDDSQAEISLKVVDTLRGNLEKMEENRDAWKQLKESEQRELLLRDLKAQCGLPPN